ncbi:MAG: DUF2304 domain-containing protein [Oscillospiraceae bacterium]
MLNIPLPLRISVIIGGLVYLVIILVLLKRKKLNVQYSIIWLAFGIAMILFAVFPYIVAVLRDIFGVEVPANLVFSVILAFVLLLLLSLSTIVTGFTARISRLAQTQALLEERVRQLEAELAAERKQNGKPQP